VVIASSGVPLLALAMGQSRLRPAGSLTIWEVKANIGAADGTRVTSGRSQDRGLAVLFETQWLRPRSGMRYMSALRPAPTVWGYMVKQ